MQWPDKMFSRDQKWTVADRQTFFFEEVAFAFGLGAAFVLTLDAFVDLTADDLAAV